jgi:hypothetical protein
MFAFSFPVHAEKNRNYFSVLILDKYSDKIPGLQRLLIHTLRVTFNLIGQ